MEIWKSILGYEGLYEVSNLGRIKSLGNNKYKKEKILQPTDNGKGYLILSLRKNKTPKPFRVHQLVAMTFLNHKPCGYELVVNHKNFIRHDNRVENLEIVTARENSNRKHLPSSSKYTGVHWNKATKKWRSVMVANGKGISLGSFKNELDASITYECALLGLTHEKDFFFINLD